MLEFGQSLGPDAHHLPLERDPSLPAIVYLPNPVRPRGMDVEIERKNPQQIYEDNCFEFLMDSLPGVFWLGPHYIDYALGRSRVADEARMDAMGFVPWEDGVALRSVAEFKSGKANGIVRKMMGISNTLDQFRRNPKMFQDILNSLDPNISFPNIYIPSDNNINVQFISPGKKQPISEPLPFQVHFYEVPQRGSPIPVTVFAAA